MGKRIWLSMIAAAVLSVAAFAPVAAQDTVTIDMNEVDDSGQSGSANITSDGDQVTVAIEIDPGEEGVPQPVHIHEGSCNELGDVAYPLEDVVDGVSESSAEVDLGELIAAEYAINVHLSEDQMDVHVACGTLPLIAPAPADDDEAAEEDDDEATEEDDDAVVDDDDDAVVDDDDMAEEEDDAAVVEDEDDDVGDVAPAAGSTGGGEAAVVLMTLMAGAAVGGGLLVRRRLHQAW